jgi:hypothetical protein
VEAVTLISQGGVPDELCAATLEHFSEAEYPEPAERILPLHPSGNCNRTYLRRPIGFGLQACGRQGARRLELRHPAADVPDFAPGLGIALSVIRASAP